MTVESEAQACPRDGKPLIIIGDDGRFMECSGFCGFRWDSFLSKEVAALEIEPSSVTWEQVAEALSLTIKKDDPSKLITFCAFILAKTEGDQINLGFQAESASGKTYIPLEVASYFPPEDVVPIAGASPTAFFHEYGAWDAERRVMVIDLRGKVLVFLDFPDYRLVEKLRTLLSKDRPTLTFKITDKSEKHGLRTKTVELRGPTTVIFCSTKLNPDEQEKTRLLLLSPEVDQAKLEQALRLIALKESDPSVYEATIGSDPRRRFLEDLAQKIWASGVKRIKIDGDLYAEFVMRYPVHKPKHQRDLPRVASLVKAHALLNYELRDLDENGALTANAHDMKAGLELYDRVSLPNELGVSPYVLKIYDEEIRPLFRPDGIPRTEVYQAHFKLTGRMANQQWYEKEIFPALLAAGLIIEEPDPENRRRHLIYPPDPTMVVGSKASPPTGDPEATLNYHSGVRGG